VTQSEIGIVIVTYFSEAEIGACLDAALASGAEVVVVDNASGDGTVREVVRHAGARLIANHSNRGFAAAVNQGIQALSTPYVLLLNPDAILVEGLEALREACDLPGAGGAGGKLIGSDGQMQIGFMARALPTPAALALEALLLNRIWRGNPVNRRYRGFALDYSKICAVEQPAGAFFMLRRSVWKKLGGFDEGFRPLWFEDVDFCRRAADAGYTLYFVPSAVARHQGGYSISKISVEKRRIYWYANLIRYAGKHFRPVASRAVCLAIVTGSFVRGSMEVVLNRSLGPSAVYWKIARLASRCAVFGWRDEVVLLDR
jgi:N-acetylglucosaminyl-diphospho-decaprenol L-rhamnosyltransferase